MDKKKYRRVNFRISQCSSEDPDYPVSELLLQSPNAKGWLSKRFCQYPQTIVYQLVQPTIIKQISILSHQTKISTKVIIHNKLDINKDWTRLGYLSLQSNVNSNYQARQLKTVNVHDKPSLFLRFSFQTNYVNNHNVFNQVGVISLCVFGDKISDAEDDKPGTPNIQNYDKNTMARLKVLEVQKKEALDQENYDKAQKIKIQIDRLKNASKAIMLLEEKKKKAVENQNYQDAKIINEQIKKLRDVDGGGPNFSMRPSGAPSEYFRQKKQPQYEEQEQEPSISPQTLANKKPVAQQQQQPPPRKQKSPPRQAQQPQSEDDRPINVRNPNPYENAEDDRPLEEEQDEGTVSPLTKEIKAECMPYFSIFDQEIFAHLFSSNHAIRERGLSMAKDEISGGAKNKNQTIEAFLYIVKKMIDDKNVSVLFSTLEFFEMGMKKLKPPVGNPYSQLIDEILEKSNDYLGHSSQKIRSFTQDLYGKFPAFPVTNKDVCYDSLTRIGKRDKPPKILIGRLKALNNLVINFQLGKNYENVIKYATKYADDKNADVRNASIQLICSISNQIGYASMLPFLKNLRPQILKTIQQKFQEAGGQDNRPNDEKPINPQKTNQAERIPIKHKKQQFEEAQNQFIQVPSQKKAVTNPEYLCEYCGRFDKKFQVEDYWDLHLFNACPMLTVCKECKQAVEIANYTAHQIGECERSQFYKRCPRCKEAVAQSTFKAHVQKKQCIPSKPPAAANRCPLCHLDIEPGKEGWRQHLAEEGCENNPRK